MERKEELPPEYPARPTYTYGDGVEFLAAMEDWRADVEEFEGFETERLDTETAEAVKAGQDVYATLLAAEEAAALMEGNQTTIRITLADFQDWRAWCENYGVKLFDLDHSMEFEWFGGSVLVVVR